LDQLNSIPGVHSPEAERLRQQRAVLTIVLATYMMIILDTSIVITGLPDIRDGLGFSPTGLSWVQNAYTLSFGGFMMLGARAGDILGRRRVYLAGLALFMLSSLVIGLAPNAATLLIARAVQGAGAAVLAPTTLSLLTIHFSEGEERNRAFAQYAAAAGIGSSLGLVLGGIFAGWISWRVGFLINVPIGLALLFAARRLLAKKPGNGGWLDIAGAVISTLGMAGLVYGIVRSATAGWGDIITLCSIAAGTTLIAVFLISQSNRTNPLLPLRLFNSRGRVGAYLARMMFLGAMVSFLFFSTQLMQGELGMTPVEAGIGFLPMTVLTFVASLGLPRLVRAYGNGPVLVAAFFLLAVGLLWPAQAYGDTYLISVAAPMLLIGIGNGLGLGPLTGAAMRGVAAEDSGAASGLVNVAHQLGGTLGLAALVTVFAAAMRDIPSPAAALAQGISAGLYGSAVLAALGLLLSFTVIIPSERTMSL
jgi:EmrB/QacA subfamily drug resistance transporter